MQKEVLTEVKTMKELLGGQELPDRDTLIKNISTRYILQTSVFGQKFKNLSNRGMNRVMNSILSLPMEDQPVKLQDSKEIECFALGQELINLRMALMVHYAQEKQKELQDVSKDLPSQG